MFDPKTPPEDESEAELALRMLRDDINMVIIYRDGDGNLVHYEERPVEEDEDSQTGGKQ
jgi:hypothetical protein